MIKNNILILTFFVFIIVCQSNFAQPVMNEIFSRGVAGNLDWIEIYNPADVQIDISGYKIYDPGGQSGSKTKKLFPAGAIIPAKGFYVIIVDTASFDGDLSGFGLSSGGDETWLEDAGGVIIDHAVIPAMPVTTTSYSRVPDGSTNWIISETITRGTSNSTTDINEENLVTEYKLNQNFPNPFNPTTTISYQIPKSGFVNLNVYNLLGKEVAVLVSEFQNTGIYKVALNAENLSSGIYFYKLTTGNFSATKKITLLK